MVVSSGLTTQGWLVAAFGRRHRPVFELDQLVADIGGGVCIESHAISVDAPGCAILRLPLLVAPLPGNQPAGCGILGWSWVLRPAVSSPALTAVRYRTGAASWARSCAPAAPGCARPRWGWPIGGCGGSRVCAGKRSPSSPTSA